MLAGFAGWLALLAGFAGWLACWLAGWLAGLLVGWFNDYSANVNDNFCVVRVAGVSDEGGADGILHLCD